MLFIFLISLLSIHAINYSSFEDFSGSSTPREIVTTQPNSPNSPNSMSALIRKNGTLDSSKNLSIGTTNNYQAIAHNNFMNDQSSMDTRDNAPHHKKYLKIICGCAVIVGVTVGIIGIVHHCSQPTNNP